MRTIPTLILTAALVTFAGPAMAEPATITIPVSSADLESAETVANLYGKVEEAAEQLCQSAQRNGSSTFSSCRREVIAVAIGQADIAELSAYAETLRARRAPGIEIASR